MGEADIEFAYLADRVSRHVCSTQEAERFVSIAFKMLEALKSACPHWSHTGPITIRGEVVEQIRAALAAAEPESTDG